MIEHVANFGGLDLSLLLASIRANVIVRVVMDALQENHPIVQLIVIPGIEKELHRLLLLRNQATHRNRAYGNQNARTENQCPRLRFGERVPDPDKNIHPFPSPINEEGGP
ncbi:hypothetical protein D9M70_607790 [compost metagenome]